jgi:prepilin-type N-terminal cleavage/methylation domain-containing protein
MINKLTFLRNKSSEEGFTLIELMIVVVIIGILAAVAIPIFANQQKEALKAGVKSDVRNLQGIVVTYLVSNPTADNLHWRMQNGVVASGFPLNNDATWNKLVQGFSASDPASIITVRHAYVGNGVGNWQNYVVLGSHPQATPSNGQYLYYFDSRTGKYAETP